MSKLTLKQKKFADEYIISGNAYQSAIDAGYSENYAKAQSNKLLDNVGIKQFLEERLKEINDAKIVTIEEAMQITSKIARGEPRKIIKYDSNGEEYEAWEYPDFKEVNKAVEHIYKINGTFTEKREIEHKGSVQFLDDIR